MKKTKNMKNNSMNHKWLIICVLFLVGVLTIPTIEAATADVDVSLLTQYPDPAKAGDTMELRVNVRNSGNTPVSDIWVEFVPDFPFTLVPGEKNRQVIDVLPNWPDEANFKVIMYKLLVNHNALDGQHEVRVRYSLNKGISWVEKSFKLDITSKEFAEIIYIDKTKLIPGQETAMIFTINNLGNAPLQNLVFSWDEPDNVVLPVNTDNTRYIKYLGPGESIALKYTVIASVNVEPDLYELNLNLEYDVKNSTSGSSKEKISTQAGVFVGGETDFDVAFSESSNGDISFSIANIGSVPAYSVSVVIPNQDGWKVSGSNSMIIGNLNKGDYTIASFKLQSATSPLVPSSTKGGTKLQDDSDAESAAKNAFFQDVQTLKVQVVYTDTMGKRNTVEKEVLLNPQSLISSTLGENGAVPAGNSGSNLKWYVLGIIIVGLLMSGYLIYRKDRGAKLKEWIHHLTRSKKGELA